MNNPLNSAKRQRGVALLVVLMLLLVVTLLGLAAMRGTLLQERMAMNVYARGVAFQAAEAALRQAENRASTLSQAVFNSVADGACSNGLCKPAADGSAAWETNGFWDQTGNTGYATVADPIDGIRPRYVIEQYGRYSLQVGDSTIAPDAQSQGSPTATAFNVYRITVRSKTPDGAEVLLQSMFRAP